MSEITGKVGRPALPKNEKRWKFISTRISEGEYREIAQAAKESGLGKTKWVRSKLVSAARRAPDQAHTIQNPAPRRVRESQRPANDIMSELTILD
jgi:hypothetical protein